MNKVVERLTPIVGKRNALVGDETTEERDEALTVKHCLPIVIVKRARERCT